ncbi:MAG: VIT1/CCC1 transporter family protein [bacterium]|nr:VIT1/CCC1 transporter family protein [bacterium]
MQKIGKADSEMYLRNFVFGVEDSLVSTVGLLSGIAAAGMTKQAIFTTGMVLVFVEAFSMAVGSFLSEYSVEEYQKNKEVPYKKPLIGSLVMFFSYFCAGLIPIIPYVLPMTFWLTRTSILLTLFSLLLLGIISGRFLNIHPVRQGIRMIIMGGAAILVGVIIGKAFAV